MYSSKSGNGFYRASFFCSALSLEVHIVESFDVETVFVGYSLPRSHSFTPSSFFPDLSSPAHFVLSRQFQFVSYLKILCLTDPYGPIHCSTVPYILAQSQLVSLRPILLSTHSCNLIHSYTTPYFPTKSR